MGFDNMVSLMYGVNRELTENDCLRLRLGICGGGGGGRVGIWYI